MSAAARLKTARYLRHKSGSVTLELIVSLPILWIALFVVVQFGLAMANLQQVARATRDGARVAAETAGLSPATTAVTVGNVRSAVDRFLESAGFGSNASAGAQLCHTVSGTGSAIDGVCNGPPCPVAPADIVQVTVCVPLTKLTPNLLSPFGYDISSNTVQFTVTMDYEN